jgi:hypothetical protein
MFNVLFYLLFTLLIEASYLFVVFSGSVREALHATKIIFITALFLPPYVE